MMENGLAERWQSETRDFLVRRIAEIRPFEYWNYGPYTAVYGRKHTA
jgi:hypothetical protein